MTTGPVFRSPFPVSPYHGQRMAEDEFLSLPEQKPYLEYVDGWALQKPWGDEAYGFIAAEFIGGLHDYATEAGGRAGVAMTVRFPNGNHRIPDVGYYARGRLRGVALPPTLAIEIRCPDQQTRAELVSKCRFFRAHGVDECWLVDPRLRTVEQFSSEGEFILGPDQTLISSALPGFELSLADLFAVLEPES